MEVTMEEKIAPSNQAHDSIKFLLATARQLIDQGNPSASLQEVLMHRQGLQSLFPMEDISVMGIWELLPHLNKIRAFIQTFALFFTSFYKAHIRVLETTPKKRTALLLDLEYLIGISYVDDTGFKGLLGLLECIGVGDVRGASHHNLDHTQAPLISGIVDGLGSPIHQRRQLYAGPMSKLRMLMICHMAKPEEVLIVEDENDHDRNINLLGTPWS